MNYFQHNVYLCASFIHGCTLHSCIVYGDTRYRSVGSESDSKRNPGGSRRCCHCCYQRRLRPDPHRVCPQCRLSADASSSPDRVHASHPMLEAGLSTRHAPRLRAPVRGVQFTYGFLHDAQIVYGVDAPCKSGRAGINGKFTAGTPPPPSALTDECEIRIDLSFIFWT